jgi:hypothetical protein
MYEPDTSEKQAAMFGLNLSEIPNEVIEVWDINWPAFSVFYAMNTQWRMAGMGGERTGLDYNAIPVVAKLLGLKSKQTQEIFSSIQVMENEALTTMRESTPNANDS